jgi:hypothetical protein
MAPRKRRDTEPGATEAPASEENSPESKPEEAPAPEPKAAATPVKDAVDHEAMARNASRVSLRGYVAKAGKKADQLAAFLHYATKQKMKARPSKDWDAEYAAFMNRPVGGGR